VSIEEALPTRTMGDGDGDVCVEAPALVAPPVSQTKGRGANRWTKCNEESAARHSTSTYKCKQTEDGHVIISGCLCGHCGLKGHYLTTCPSNLNRSRAAERM
jgi:hypothetical protein